MSAAGYPNGVESEMLYNRENTYGVPYRSRWKS